MKVAVLGRTGMLIAAADSVAARGHSIVVVATATAEQFYDAGVDDYEKLAKRHGAKFLGSVSLRQKAGIKLLKSVSADIAISINWPSVLGQDVLAIFEHGVLNAHAGDLPRYRGNACPNWAILNGEERVGLCIHQMAPDELDAGPIFVNDYLPLADDTYIADVYAWMGASVPSLFAKAVDGIADGTLRPVAQPLDPALSLRCYPRRPDDARLVWTKSVDDVLRLIRASSHPFDGAFAFLEADKKVTVWRAARESHRGQFSAVPGQVCSRAENDPVVACGDGVIRLVDVSIDGCAGSDEAKSLIHRSLRNRLT
jgi:methionyl-tRNA formyltransferase